MSEAQPVVSFVDSLVSLGFSQYEARCYEGLLGVESQTGYGLAKRTGVPQPKVYENLRKLVARGAAHEISGEPATFVAEDPDRLFSQLQSTFTARLQAAESSARALVGEADDSTLERVQRLYRDDLVMAAARTLVQEAERRVYVSASAAETDELRPVLEEATSRGVDVVLLSFGAADFTGSRIKAFRHASTEGALYRAHRARHVAIVSDSRDCVVSIAADGTDWQGIRSESVPIIAAVKGFIRHDIDLQQVYADFGPMLVEAYGPGLQRLESYRQERGRAVVDDEPTTATQAG